MNKVKGNKVTEKVTKRKNTTHKLVIVFTYECKFGSDSTDSLNQLCCDSYL